MELRQRLREIPTSNILWMHGKSDHRVSLEAGLEIVEIFSEYGWNVEKIQHYKGHMIPIEFHLLMKEWLEDLQTKNQL